MEWTHHIDGYCERLGPAYWAEPVNAITNLAFIVAAVWLWRRSAGVPKARILSLVVGAIGVGSYLFHTHAQVWAAAADVFPIFLFIILYLYAINRDAVGLSRRAAVGATVLFVPYAGMMVPLFQMVPNLGASAGYAPVALLILIYAGFLRHRQPDLARGMALGGGLLILSLTFRTLDEPLCDIWPLGTHFMWHILNGIMLGWMIEVYRRLRLGKAAHAG
ncbi:MAG: ceramidase domain-containing protein [Roseobacter sp.]